jgi:hypothetical protein
MHHLAQINVGRLLAPLDDPRIAEFAENLDRINAIGDASPGFVWRLQTDDGDATSIRAFDDPLIIVNMTVWTSAEALRDFVYRTDHVGFLRRRREWFLPYDGPFLSLWWIPAGTVPTVADGKAALDRIADNGPSPDAFTLGRLFPPPGADKSAA